MSLLVIFKGDIPQKWAQLKIEGLEVVSAKSGLPDIRGKFAVVVGDRELAEKLGVGFLTEDEAEEFFNFLVSYAF